MNTSINPGYDSIEAPSGKYLTGLIGTEFPIASQTTEGDKRVLLKLRTILGALSTYAYVEIGSYLGGSLTPFLRDAQCVRILSIDDRGRDQPDERGRTYDYRSISHQTMLENLSRHSVGVDKLTTFDGSVSDYRDDSVKYDCLFIDGEHTDWACFRDFVHGSKLLKGNAIVAFHDSTLICKALILIHELLVSNATRFKFFKVIDSEMSVILLGDFCSVEVEKFFTAEVDLRAYCDRCEKELLVQKVRNGLGFGELFRELLVWFYRRLPEGIKSPLRNAFYRNRPI